MYFDYFFFEYQSFSFCQRVKERKIEVKNEIFYHIIVTISVNVITVYSYLLVFSYFNNVINKIIN